MKQTDVVSEDASGSGITPSPAPIAFDPALDRALDAARDVAAALYPQARSITIAAQDDRAPAPAPIVSRSRAGGLARAATAIRSPDGKFVGADTIAELFEEDREAKARGGRARARAARRSADGRFL